MATADNKDKEDTAVGGTFSDRITGRIAQLWLRYMSAEAGPDESERIAETALEGAPVLWLLGKVQSGKSSIVKAVTGASDAEVGTGFKACTRTARVFDFPAEAPLIRFLDTRGLGERGYDPSEDLEVARQKAHALLVVVRAMDPSIDSVIDAVATVRRAQPDWPVIVAQTCLHEAYVPGEGHVLPYPFRDGVEESERLSGDLIRSLDYQRRRFEAVGGGRSMHFVPIDFTQAGDGFEPRYYGLDSLLGALSRAAPASVSDILGQLQASGRDHLRQRAHPRILGHASVAAAVDTVPLAGAVVVPGVQARLLQVLARIYDTAWDRRTLMAFAGCLGVGIVARLLAGFGIRQVVKLIPVYGQTAGAAAAAASSFATTYALGQAAIAFLAGGRAGKVDADAVTRAYREALTKAFDIERHKGMAGSDRGATQDAS